ncbi:MAG: heme exporter protein C [Bacteroidia bacterium]
MDLGSSIDYTIFVQRMSTFPFRKNWWKYLGALLVIYSIIVGTMAKVGPGVVDVSPTHVDGRYDFEIEIEGYNTSFTKLEQDKDQKNQLTVWIKIDKTFNRSVREKIIDDNHISCFFRPIDLITDSTYSRTGSIVIEDVYHGIFIGPDMINVDFTPDPDNGLGQLVSIGEPPRKKQLSYFSFPYRYILNETIRNLNFHVPMWFAMIAMLFMSFGYSIRFLNTKKPEHDYWANGYAKVGLLFGLMGIATGMFWANFTWGTPWTNDPKLNGAAVAVLMYIAYQILRSSIEDDSLVGRISAIYNIFSFPIFIVLIIVLPRMADFSLHPGAGDSVGFNTYDLDSNLRKVFYPAVMGWILVAGWISQVTVRIDKLTKQFEEWYS